MAQSLQLCLAVSQSHMRSLYIQGNIEWSSEGQHASQAALCPTTVTLPFPEKHLLMAGQWGSGCAGKIIVCSYYTIYCTHSHIWIYFFSVYTCLVLLTLVDLSRCMSGQNQSLCSVSEKGVRSWAGVLNTTHDY